MLCKTCNIEKSEDRFEVIKASGNRRRTCRECINLKIKARREADPDKWRRNRTSAILKFKYGITIEQYETLLASQDGACAICSDVVDYFLHVDHEHECCSGQVTCGNCIRDLLCRPCNAGMGMMRDDPARLRSAADYLEGRRVQLNC